MKNYPLWKEPPLLIDGKAVPTFTYYPAKVKRTTATTIIFPGGGYAYTTEYDGKNYALHLNETLGMDAFVLHYRTLPYHFPVPLLDARRAVRFVRANAEEFGIDPNLIAVIGSSAGGHLAALVSTYKGEIEGEGVDEIDDISARPDFTRSAKSRV